MKKIFKMLLSTILATLTMLYGCICTLVMSQEAQWELLSEAYRYTFPLVLMDKTMKAATNSETPDLAGHAPVNQLIHSQKLADSNSTLVVTPNVDTIYTHAWLDLSDEPLVFVMPQTDRFFQTQVLNAWTDTPAVLESGKYLIAKTGWKGTVPEGLKKVEISTDMVWMITRTLIDNPQDITNVRAIQGGMQLLPLSAYISGGDYTPPKGEYKKEYEGKPIDAVLSMTPQEFFAAANELMLSNPPSAYDAALVMRIAKLNIGPGKTFQIALMKGDIAAQWKGMLQSLKPALVQAGAQYQHAMGKWTYFGAPIGNFGTAYDYRAMIALGGLGANPVEVAVYAKTGIDSSDASLSGANSYKLHFETLPPTEDGGFWSVTAYGSNNLLIANELGRYCINDRSGFTLNDDGSLDIILSATAPENQSNWLPVSEDEFHLFMRIYLPDNDALESWVAPVITKY